MASHPTRRAMLHLPVLAAPALAGAQVSPNDTVHIAFIGVGNRGGYLLTQMLQVPGVRVVAMADIAPETLAAAGRVAEASGHKAALYSDYRKMLEEHKEIDAVVIATPVNTHKDIAIATLDVGKHVYCEKPMALNPEECRMVVNAARSAKGIFQSGFQLRHDPARRAAVEFIRRGGMGRILYLQGFRHTGDLPRNTPWYFDRTISGDNIVEQACHILDLFTWAVDQPPLRAYGSGGINLFKDIPPGRTTMDNYTVIYEYPNDIRLSFSHIYFDPPGFSGIHERVWCENGAIELAAATWIPRERKEEIKLDVPDAGVRADYLSLAAFIENARGKKTPLNNAESARRSTLVAMLGRKAIYERRIVEWREVDV